MNLKQTCLPILAATLLSCQQPQPASAPPGITGTEAVHGISHPESHCDAGDTLLKHGYHLAPRYSVFSHTRDTVFSYHLMHGRREIREIGLGGSCTLLPHSLGYLYADFDSSFAMAAGSGGGNPTDFFLFRKSDGKLLKTGYLVDAEEEAGYLLYIPDLGNPGQGALYDCAEEKSRLLPACIPTDPGVAGHENWYFTSIHKVTPAEIIVLHTWQGRKTYIRMPR